MFIPTIARNLLPCKIMAPTSLLYYKQLPVDRESVVEIVVCRDFRSISSLRSYQPIGSYCIAPHLSVCLPVCPSIWNTIWHGRCSKNYWTDVLQFFLNARLFRVDNERLFNCLILSVMSIQTDKKIDCGSLHLIT